MPRQSIPLADRFWSKVTKTDTCWLWTAAQSRSGYGRMSSRTASRVAWELENGPIPDGLCVLHRCDVRNCVRPDHLFLGTRADNAADRQAKGRTRNGVCLGTANGSARLNDLQVIDIRQRYAAGSSLRTLAAEFHVVHSTIAAIVNRRAWKHIE